jgi:hypothetical protein
MDDCEKLIPDTDYSVANKNKKIGINERDDLSGMALNMCSKLDPRKFFILWLCFLFIHTEMCADHFLKKINGATNNDGSMTMKGTIYASFIMLIVILICELIF